MNLDDVRMIAGIAASLVASVGVMGLAVLGAYLIATDHRRSEESMRQHQRAMRSLDAAHKNVRSSGPVRPLPSGWRVNDAGLIVEAGGPEPSPAGAIRERAVPCRRCRASTWNHSAVCDRCRERSA